MRAMTGPRIGRRMTTHRGMLLIGPLRFRNWHCSATQTTTFCIATAVCLTTQQSTFATCLKPLPVLLSLFAESIRFRGLGFRGWGLGFKFKV